MRRVPTGAEEDELIVGLKRLAMASSGSGPTGRAAACRGLAYLAASNMHNQAKLAQFHAHPPLLAVLACNPAQLAEAEAAAWAHLTVAERLAAGGASAGGEQQPPAGFMLLNDAEEMASVHRFKGGRLGPRVEGWPSVAVPAEEQPTDRDGRARGRRLLELEDLLASRTLWELHSGAAGPERRWAAAALASMAYGSAANAVRLVEAGALGGLAELLAHGNDSGRDEASRAMYNLSNGSTTAGLKGSSGFTLARERLAAHNLPMTSGYALPDGAGLVTCPACSFSLFCGSSVCLFRVSSVAVSQSKTDTG